MIMIEFLVALFSVHSNSRALTGEHRGNHGRNSEHASTARLYRCAEFGRVGGFAPVRPGAGGTNTSVPSRLKTCVYNMGWAAGQTVLGHVNGTFDLLPLSSTGESRQAFFLESPRVRNHCPSFVRALQALKGASIDVKDIQAENRMAQSLRLAGLARFPIYWYRHNFATRLALANRT